MVTHTSTVSQQISQALTTCGKLQKTVAYEAGFSRPNVIPMLKKGVMRVPPERVVALADALEMDLLPLVKAASEEYGWPVMRITKEVLTRVLTTGDTSSLLSEEQQRKLLELAKSMVA